MEKEKNATKEPFDTTPFAQLLFGPCGRQTGAIFLAFGIPGDHGDCAPSVACIQAMSFKPH
jgi:hypothetical protein